MALQGLGDCAPGLANQGAINLEWMPGDRESGKLTMPHQSALVKMPEQKMREKGE
jgi:hypothetical protein